MAKPRILRARRAIVLCAAGLALFVLGCAGSATGDSNNRENARAYHQSVLRQLEQAWQSRDLTTMQRLLSISRAGADAEQSRRYAGFEQLLAGSEIELDGFERRGFFVVRDPKVKARDADMSFTEAERFTLVLRPTIEHNGRILAHGRDGVASRLVFVVEFNDLLENGSRTTTNLPQRLTFKRDFELSNEHPLEIPLPKIETPAPTVMVRRLRFHGYVLPAAFEWDGNQLSLPRLELQPLEITMFPKGFRAIRKQPLRVLRIVSGNAEERRGHLVVASWFVDRDGTAKQKDAALGILIELLRSGSALLDPTVRTCLQMIAGDQAPVRQDRDSWLRWWSLRGNR